MTAGNQGFTLMEVMVSMAVMAIVLTTLFKLQSSTIALSGAAQFKSLAPVLARQTLAELELKDFDPDELSVEFEDGFNGYTRSCDLEKGAGADFEDILSEPAAALLAKIRVTIYSPGRERNFSFVTWRYVHEK